MFRQRNKRGVSLIETLVYVAILAIILTFVMSGVLSLFKVSERVRSSRLINQTASVALERMVRDIRDAVSIDISGSILDIHPGSLTMLTVGGGGANISVKYALSGDKLVRILGTDEEIMTPNNVVISQLVFKHITTTNSEAVKIKMLIEDEDQEIGETREYSIIVVLRNSY